MFGVGPMAIESVLSLGAGSSSAGTQCNEHSAIEELQSDCCTSIRIVLGGCYSQADGSRLASCTAGAPHSEGALELPVDCFSSLLNTRKVPITSKILQESAMCAVSTRPCS